LTFSHIDANDASTVKTFRLDAGTPTSIAAGAGAVWLTVQRGSLIRIDPEFGAVTATVDPDPVPQYDSGAVAVGGAGVWFTGPSGAAQIDPSSNRVALVVPEAGGFSGAIAVGADSVWVAVALDPHGGGGTLYKISGRGVVATAPLRRHPVGIAVGTGTVWVVLDDGDLIAIDPDTAAVVTNIDAARATSVAIAAGDVWVTSDDGTLRRIDSARRVVTKTIQLGRPAVAVAAAGPRVWAAVN
jgi:hypothetical protein